MDTISRVAVLIGLAACVPAHQAPASGVERTTSSLTVAPEIAIGTPVPFPNPNTEDNVAVASDGTTALVAWTQTQLGTAYKRYDLATGQLLDPDGIVLGLTDFISVAYGGGKFAVVGNYAGQVIAYIVGQDGLPEVTSTVIAAGSTIFPSNHQFHPVVAWTGRNFLVVPDTAAARAAVMPGPLVMPQGRPPTHQQSTWGWPVRAAQAGRRPASMVARSCRRAVDPRATAAPVESQTVRTARPRFFRAPACSSGC